MQGLTDHVQGWSASQEGVVIAFEPSGHRLKLKSAAYVALHRARDDYSMEHRVLEVWSNGNQNALCLNLAQDRAQRLREYYERLEAAIEKASERIGRAARKTWLENGGSRKEAAVAWVAETDNRPPTRAAGFSAFNALARGSCGEGGSPRAHHQRYPASLPPPAIHRGEGPTAARARPPSVEAARRQPARQRAVLSARPRNWGALPERPGPKETKTPPTPRCNDKHGTAISTTKGQPL